MGRVDVVPADDPEIHRCYRFLTSRQTLSGRPVIVKTARENVPPSRGALPLAAEAAILRKVDVPGVARLIELRGPEDAPALVLEDAGTLDLEARLGGGPLPLDEFFDIATQLADICARIHAKGVVHRAIAPSRVILDEKRRVTLVHFMDAALSTSVPRPIDSESLVALAWMSPEQTGRMNRLVDKRSDLYSLGATFYAMLTGAPPFRSSDPLELMYAQLAQVPVPAAIVDPRVPEALSAILDKLLAKMPERRYQSAEALAADLRKAQRQWLATGRIVPFELGLFDLATLLPLPEHLYGRDKELAVLRNAFARASVGGSELMLIEGEGGVGKTALVVALRDVVLQQGALFVAGKFDLRAANMPYSSIIEVLRALARGFLLEPPARREEISQKLREAVQTNGRVLSRLVPELEEILGELPEVPALGPVETENRFHRTLQAFVRAVALERPLIILLDDLQWTDAASLRVLRALTTDPESRHLLLLGVYRPREVVSSHPLAQTLAEIRAMGVTVRHIHLGPLDIDAIVELLSDTLRCEPARVRPFAKLLLHKTAGNPFFIRQLIYSLQQKHLLEFDPKQGTWTWDLSRIEHVKITENVAELLTELIHRLPEETQGLLRVAACMGKRFELRALASSWDRSIDETSARVGELLRDGLVMPDDALGERESLGFCFVHDRVQQAAYASASEEKRKALHLQIARRMLEREGEDGHSEKLFDLVDHFDLGIELIRDREERIRVAGLNHRAGRKARRSAAYGAALAYFRAGLGLLPEVAWQKLTDLTYALHRDAAECASLSGEHRLCRALALEGLRHVHSMVEAASLQEIRITSATMTSEYELALLWGWEALRSFFGIEKPKKDEIETEIAAQRKAIGMLLAGRSPEELIERPFMTKAEDRVYLKLISVMLAPAWFTDRKLLMLLTVNSVRFTLERGHASESILPYGEYGLLLVSLGELRLADSMSHLAMGLAAKLEDRLQETRAFQLYNTFVRAWSTPFSTCAIGARKVVEMGREVGDFQQAAYGRTMIVIYSLLAGLSLDRVLLELNEGLLFCRQIGSESQRLTHVAYRQMIRCLKGLTRGRDRFDDDDFDEASFREVTQNDPSVVCIYDILRLQSSFLFRDLAEARALSESAAQTVDLLGGYVVIVEHTFYSGLTAVAKCENASADERRALLSRADAARSQLLRWEVGCPRNFRHKRLLLQAEIEGARGHFLAAAELYDQAIDAAAKVGCLGEEALGNELTGRYYHGLGRARIAELYLRAARQGFAKWGATAKARALDDEFALEGRLEVASVAPESASYATLDGLSLLKAAETISGEIVLERLLEKLMEVCLEAACAERCVLVFEEETGPVVRAVGRTRELVSLERTPLSASKEVPQTLIARAEETRQVLVIDDAAAREDLSADPYFAGGRAGSILILPILRMEVLLGVFYFENKLATHAFTRERARVLELLSAQIAIALENSRLFLEAQDAIRIREDFLCVASHELKTPITSMHLAIQSLRRGRKPLSEEQLLRIFGTMERQVQRLQRLVNDLLDVSRLHTGKLELHLEQVDLSALVGEIVERLGETIARSKSDVTVRADAPVWGRWDKSRLDQVVTNLLDNAIKFGAGEPIELIVMKKDNKAELLVRDKGIGIAPERVNYVFERFERAVSTRHYGGFGLGLYIVQSIVSALGGTIRVDSALGHGSTFTVELPCGLTA